MGGYPLRSEGAGVCIRGYRGWVGGEGVRRARIAVCAVIHCFIKCTVWCVHLSATSSCLGVALYYCLRVGEATNALAERVELTGQARKKCLNDSAVLFQLAYDGDAVF